MNGEIVLTPLELLAIAALPLSTMSGMLKRVLLRYVPQGRERRQEASDDAE